MLLCYLIYCKILRKKSLKKTLLDLESIMATSINTYNTLPRAGHPNCFKYVRKTSTVYYGQSWTITLIVTNTAAKVHMVIDTYGSLYSQKCFWSTFTLRLFKQQAEMYRAKTQVQRIEDGKIKCARMVKRDGKREGDCCLKALSPFHSYCHILIRSWGPLSEQSNTGLSSFLWNDPRPALQHMSALSK